MSARAMREAKTIAAGRTWGEACTLLVKHPLARVKILDRWLHLNRGPFPGAGDPGSLNANFYSYHERVALVPHGIGPSMRFVLDWSDVDAFTLTGALGQSGNPFSPHYDDFLDGDAWRNVPFTRGAGRRAEGLAADAHACRILRYFAFTSAYTPYAASPKPTTTSSGGGSSCSAPVVPCAACGLCRNAAEHERAADHEEDHAARADAEAGDGDHLAAHARVDLAEADALAQFRVPGGVELIGAVPDDAEAGGRDEPLGRTAVP